ncbi:hypothetical protein SISNIDRAFT_452985, partial [Sistotremastrum niveocremeum HHB9708]
MTAEPEILKRLATYRTSLSNKVLSLELQNLININEQVANINEAREADRERVTEAMAQLREIHGLTLQTRNMLSQMMEDSSNDYRVRPTSC